MRGVVLQRFRSRGSVIRGSAAVEGCGSDTKEPPFAIAQIFVLALFIVLTTIAVKKFRIGEAVCLKGMESHRLDGRSEEGEGTGWHFWDCLDGAGRH
jgi:hypothetical protein